MTTSQDLILQIWETKLSTYSNKKTKQMLKQATASLIIFVIPILFSKSNSKIINVILTFFFFHSLSTIYLWLRINKIKSTRRREAMKYQTIALLANLQQIMFLTALMLALFCTGWSASINAGWNIINNNLLTGSIITLYVIFLLAILLLPSISIYKANEKPSSLYIIPLIKIYRFDSWQNRRPRSVSTQVHFYIFILLFGILGAFARAGNMPSMAILSFGVSIFLLYFIFIEINGMFILLINQWPKIEKDGRRFVFLNTPPVSNI